MPLLTQKWIFRADLRNSPDWTYVFGDNLLRCGLGGQAKAMRGEPNAVGIATKCSPSEYANDAFALEFLEDWVEHFTYLDMLLARGDVVVWPEDGIGTGLADMANQAPILWQTLELLRKNLFAAHTDTQ